METTPPSVPKLSWKIPKMSPQDDTPRPLRRSLTNTKDAVVIPTLAVSRTFVYSTINVIDDETMASWVRNLSIELVKRLVYDRHWNRREAKVLMVIVTCKSEEVRTIHPLEKYECESVIAKVHSSIFDNPKMRDEGGVWAVSHIYLSVDGFKELGEHKGSIAGWLRLRGRDDAEVGARVTDTFQSGDVVTTTASLEKSLIGRMVTNSNQDDEESIGPVSVEYGPTGGAVRVQGRRGAQKKRNNSTRKTKARAVTTNKKTDTKKVPPKKVTDLRKAAYGSRKITEFFNCSG